MRSPARHARCSTLPRWVRRGAGVEAFDTPRRDRRRALRRALDLTLAAVNLAPPAAFLGAAALDIPLESFDRALNVRAHRAERVADILEQALRLVLHRQSHSRARRR